ncbi:biotin-dependent carboxyltransferase family protein [Niallia circulans]|uniref:Biotin-dependent carboxyltransferase family protein n=1 Tax=Niallia circulans TaxID=1397 RepID=A0A553SGR7_NIACI|nr:biotin-dependent carboxyltransferase family protein [Niallia circulans]TRZ36178.1 biotin-dependent carboxyltransferase family protein [Niallia circulans]
MSLRVERPGLLTSLQDLGRYGYQKYGVIVGGAMDSISLRIANLLVGNQEKEAVLEMTLVGASFIAEQDLLIAVTGGDMLVVIDEKTVPLWRPVFMKKGSQLRFQSSQTGCRTYLAVAGGFAVDEVMESKSTYLRGELGGYKGRRLQTGDIINCGIFVSTPISEQLRNSLSGSFSATKWHVNPESFINLQEKVIRVLKGGEFELFTKESQEHFFKGEYQITPNSDRMGFRLQGAPLEMKEPLELISEPVTNGTIQVPKDGNPIVLLADRQTTGGYPKFAQVATVDLPLLAQKKPGEKIRFKEISLEEAEQLYIRQEQHLEKLKAGLQLKTLKMTSSAIKL